MKSKVYINPDGYYPQCTICGGFLEFADPVCSSCNSIQDWSDIFKYINEFSERKENNGK